MSYVVIVIAVDGIERPRLYLMGPNAWSRHVESAIVFPDIAAGQKYMNETPPIVPEGYLGPILVGKMWA